MAFTGHQFKEEEEDTVTCRSRRVWWHEFLDWEGDSAAWRRDDRCHGSECTPDSGTTDTCTATQQHTHVVQRPLYTRNSPSVLWHCWLGSRKSIRPVESWVVRYWRGYLSKARCKWFACGSADATATPSSLAPVKSRMVYLLMPAYPGCPGRRPLNGCCSSTVTHEIADSLNVMTISMPIMTLRNHIFRSK